MKSFYDVSIPISSEMLTWPGDPAVAVRRRSSIAAGDTANVSELILGSHTGTHVDAPVHFIEGAGGVDEIPIEAMNGEAFVADARGMTGALDGEQLDRLNIPDGVERLLLRSDNSRLWRERRPAFPESYVCLSPAGAAWCVDRGLRAVGVDFLSVEQKGAEGHPTHVALLRAGIAIIEGLDLDGVEPGSYDLVCLPLKILGCDGAPARVALIAR
ncbi:MAG TPA: cyclase family protein [Actinomycetota bacterium]